MPKYGNKWGIIEEIPIGELLNGRVSSTEEEDLFPCPCPVWVLSILLGYGCSQTAHS